jgi:hypothetical protein
MITKKEIKEMEGIFVEELAREICPALADIFDNLEADPRFTTFERIVGNDLELNAFGLAVDALRLGVEKAIDSRMS